MLSRRRRATQPWLALAAIFVMASCLFTACKTTKGISGEPAEDFTLTASLEKSVYRLGECVYVKVKLTNNTGKTAQHMRALDHGSLSFYFGRKGDPERMKRDPVVAAAEPDNQMIDLAPGQTVERTFLLTRFTGHPGSMVAQAHYDPNPPMATGPYEKLYSSIVSFDVTPQELFERDSEGNLTKREAIRVAQALAPGDVQAADAVLAYDDDHGTYLWWVNLKVAVAGQQPVLKAWLISPYTGKSKGEARPFDPKLAANPRLSRPPKKRAENADESAF